MTKRPPGLNPPAGVSHLLSFRSARRRESRRAIGLEITGEKCVRYLSNKSRTRAIVHRSVPSRWINAKFRIPPCVG